MWLKIIFITIATVLVATCQISLMPNLGFLSLANISLVTLILIVFINSKRNAFFWTALLGLFFDVWSFYWFGAHLTILITILFLNFLAVDNFFTNKSIYSYLFLIFISTIIHDFYWLVVASVPTPIVVQPEFALLELQKTGLNMAIGIILFYLAISLNTGFQSVILVKKKY